MKPASKLAWAVGAAWLIVLGSYVAIAAMIPPGANRNALGDVLLCLIPLLVNGALLANAMTPHRRNNAFWMLLALGSTLWLTGQFVWTVEEVYRHRAISAPFLGDIFLFLRAIPMIAALAMQPHKRPSAPLTVFTNVDLALLTTWWIYLYAFTVLPWHYAVANNAKYVLAFRSLSIVENLVFVVGAAALALSASGHWRRVYAILAAAGAVYTTRLLVVEVLIARSAYSRVSLYTLPAVVFLLLIGTAGVSAYQSRSQEEQGEFPQADPAAAQFSGGTRWASRAAQCTLLSLPLIAVWSVKASHASEAVRTFRILITLGAILLLGFLAFLREELIDSERLHLLRASQESLDNLKRLQTQFVQSEKLASIGQLVGGVAHEINNPLTAILGYSELLAEDPAADSRARSIAEKIRVQARRTKTLVNNLLSFARQTPSEQRSPLDVNTIVNTAVQFRRVDLRGKNIFLEVKNGLAIPEVRGDATQLLQVFSNIINNAVDAMEEVGGGTLTVRTLFERGNVVILFTDTGKGIRDPQLVFDPFYTTKPVGKGTGLGLSICYGLVQDQGGKISCQNRPEGGATFRIELQAIPTLFPASAGNTSPHGKPAKLA